MSESADINLSRNNFNAYAFAVKEAMRSAGIPPGADVALFGHSFGGYTAMELASDPDFNGAIGAGPAGYHVNVTHVLSAGANVGFHLDDLPPTTHAVAMVNEFDAAVGLERGIELNNDVRSDANHTLVSYRDVGALRDGWGHQPTAYADFVRSAQNTQLMSFLSDSSSLYGGEGELVRVTVKDPFR